MEAWKSGGLLKNKDSWNKQLYFLRASAVNFIYPIPKAKHQTQH